MTNNCQVIANLKPSAEIDARLTGGDPSLPLWFGAAIRATGVSLNNSLRPLGESLRSVFRRSKTTLLCFNPSGAMLLAFLLPIRISRISLYQWESGEQLPASKRVAIHILLARSDAILTYSQGSAAWLRQRFPSKPVHVIGLFADTDFFSPAPGGLTKKGPPFLLVPGDHRRDEGASEVLARVTGYQVIRVTRDHTAAERARAVGGFEVRESISFLELRDLYRTAAAVVILSDSSSIPAGITTLAEALSCGARVAIPRGHATSWPEDLAATERPFLELTPGCSAEVHAEQIREWLEGTRGPSKTSAEISGFARRHLSLATVSAQWARVFATLN